MRITLMIVSIWICFLNKEASCQEILNEKQLISEDESKNIEVLKLFSDSLSTTFIIFIKDEVKAHKHEYHSETIYVLNGSGKMVIGSKSFNVKTGSIFNIPINTVHSLKVNSAEKMKVISFQSPEFLGKDRVFVE